MIIKVRVLKTDFNEEEIQDWTLGEVLDEINRDRSSEWIPYDKDDWLDGWNEWIEGEFYSLVEK